jgi:hypothetical protein
MIPDFGRRLTVQASLVGVLEKDNEEIDCRD